MYKRTWEKSEFNCFIRIKKEKLEFLKTIKKKKSLAGKLNEIIDYYKIKNYDKTNKDS